jgi:hypothetical protein
MGRHRFTLEYECDDADAGRLREVAIDAVAGETDGQVTGHVVRDVAEGDPWDALPLMDK